MHTQLLKARGFIFGRNHLLDHVCASIKLIDVCEVASLLPAYELTVSLVWFLTSQSTAMVMLGRSVPLTTLFPRQV